MHHLADQRSPPASSRRLYSGPEIHRFWPHQNSTSSHGIHWNQGAGPADLLKSRTNFTGSQLLGNFQPPSRMIPFTPEKFWLPAYVLSRQMRRVKGREYSTHSVSEGAHRPQIRRLTSRFAKQRNRSAENQATAFRTTQSNTQLIKRMKSLYSSLIEGGSPPAIVVNGVSHKVTLRSRRTGPADAATLALSVISS